MAKDKLIYASAARKAILKEDPKLAYCIDSIPGVDAGEVVRCKDCKIAFASPAIADFPKLLCRKWSNWHVVEQNDFCSYGERRTKHGK